MTPKPLKDGSGWYVVISWSTLREEQIYGFVTEFEAEVWIRDASPAWLAARNHPQDAYQLEKSFIDEALAAGTSRMTQRLRRPRATRPNACKTPI
jgi:hypothetical protein